MEIVPEFLARLLDSIGDGVYFVDLDRRITYWNQGAERISGFESEQVSGTRCADGILMHVDGDGKLLCENGCPLRATMVDGQDRSAEVFLHHRDGYRVPVLVRASPVRDSSGTIVGGVEVFSDNTERVEALQRVAQLERGALIDHLTGLANRRYGESFIGQRLDEMRRYGWPFGVIFLDLDGFKAFNDGYGHETGDRMLQVVAGALKASLRSFDLACRWGGDEFVVVVANVDETALTSIGERIRMMIRESFFEVGGARTSISTSVGSATAIPTDDIGSLVARADESMYQDKMIRKQSHS